MTATDQLCTAQPHVTGRRVAVLGSAGLVGRTLVESLTRLSDVWHSIALFDVAEHAGAHIEVRGHQHVVHELTDAALADVDVAICALPEDLAKVWVPKAAQRDITVVDCSGVYRDEPAVPLLAAHVNLAEAERSECGVYSSPSSLALSALTALWPLHRQWGLASVNATALMPASAMGRSGSQRLLAEMAVLSHSTDLGRRSGDVRARLLDELDQDSSPFAAPLALNVSPWVGSAPDFDTSSSAPERAFRSEVQRVLQTDDVKISVTCMQVPVLVGETLSFHLTFKKPVSVAAVREVLVSAPSVVVIDDVESLELPTPIDAVGSDPAFAGRIRQEEDSPRSVSFVQCSDNLRLGSAVNAALIAQSVVSL